jgi:hypothetical protein
MDSQGAIISIGTEWGHNTFIEEDARCVSLTGRQCKQPLSDESEVQHWEQKKIEQRESPNGKQNTNGRDGMDEKRLDRYNSAQSPLVKCAKKRGTSIAPRDGRRGGPLRRNGPLGRAAGRGSSGPGSTSGPRTGSAGRPPPPAPCLRSRRGGRRRTPPRGCGG